MRTYTSALRMPKREHKKAKAFDRKNRNCKVARTGQRNRYGCGRAENYSLWVVPSSLQQQLGALLSCLSQLRDKVFNDNCQRMCSRYSFSLTHCSRYPAPSPKLINPGLQNCAGSCVSSAALRANRWVQPEPQFPDLKSGEPCAFLPRLLVLPRSNGIDVCLAWATSGR